VDTAGESTASAADTTVIPDTAAATTVDVIRVTGAALAIVDVMASLLSSVMVRGGGDADAVEETGT
jgi:hypothetical protein